MTLRPVELVRAWLGAVFAGVPFASVLGRHLAMISAAFLLQSWVQKRFRQRLMRSSGCG